MRADARSDFDDLLNRQEDQTESGSLWIQKLQYLQDFIEFSQVSHLTLDKSGRVLNCNLMMGTLLRIHRSMLIGQSM